MKDRLVLFFGEWQKNIETASLNYYSGGELKEQKLDSVFITNNKYYLILIPQKAKIIPPSVKSVNEP